MDKSRRDFLKTSLAVGMAAGAALKKLILIATAVLALFSCSKPSEKVYDADEYCRIFNVVIDWSMWGYDKISNDTANDVVLSLFMPTWKNGKMDLNRFDFEIKSNKDITFEKNEQAENGNLFKCDSLSITLPDQSVIGLSRRMHNEPSKLFFNNYDRSFVDTIIEFDGDKLRRHLPVDKYHITEEMIK